MAIGTLSARYDAGMADDPFQNVDAGSLRIVCYPADVLRRKAVEVPAVDETVVAVAHRMVDLMREAEGIGLAAPQVGLPWRMFVCEVPGGDAEAPVADATPGPVVYINPRIENPKMPMVVAEEGCLSLPGLNGEVRRPEGVTVRYTDIDGQPASQRGTELLARCWQHEQDHLDGVLIFDRFTQAERKRTAKELAKLEEVGGGVR